MKSKKIITLIPVFFIILFVGCSNNENSDDIKSNNTTSDSDLNPKDSLIENEQQYSNKETEIFKDKPNDENQLPNEEEITKKNKEYIEELKERIELYGEETELGKGQEFTFHGEEITNGQLFNDDPKKSIDKWYFIAFNEPSKKYSLIIDETCYIHSVGFRNGYCRNFFSFEDNKNAVYDGSNGPAVQIYGQKINNNSIKVSDILFQQ